MDDVTRRTLTDAEESLRGLTERLNAQIGNLRAAVHIPRVSNDARDALTEARLSLRLARLIIEEVLDDEGR